jgi:hypothetical protein
MGHAEFRDARHYRFRKDGERFLPGDRRISNAAINLNFYTLGALSFGLEEETVEL